MAKFSKSGAQRESFLSVNIRSSNLSFCSGPHHVFQDFSNDVDGSIGFGDCRVEAGVGKEVMATNAATGFGGGEIGSIAVDMENHVTGVKPDNSARESGNVVEEVNKGVHGLFSAIGLSSGKVAQGHKKEAIHRKGIVEEGANNGLDVIDVTGSEFGGHIRWGCPLCCGTIDWADPLGGRAHRAGGSGMLELVKGLGNVIRHGDVDVAMGVIPGNGEAKVRCTGPVNCDGVAGAERVDEVLRVLLINIFHSKVINNKGERDG